MAFTPEQLALVSQYSPSYKAALKNEANAAHERRSAVSQAEQRAQYMKDNKGTVLGREGQLGLPSQNPSLQTQAGTGMYRQGIDPREAFQRERNYTLNTSGMPLLEKEGMGGASNMQQSIMSAVNAAPKKAGARWSNIKEGNDGRFYGIDRDTNAYAEIPNSPTAPAKAPLVQVGDTLRNINDQVAYDDQMAANKNARTYVNEVVDYGRESMRSIGNYDRMLGLLQTTPTGTLEEQKMAAKKLAGSLGFNVDTDTIRDGEQLRAMLGDEVMKRVAQTKGAVSEREMQLFKEYSANYGNTNEGNIAILEFARARAKRDEVLGKLARSMQRDKASSFEIEAAINDYMNENPLGGTIMSGSSAAGGVLTEEWLKKNNL